ncbi:MAG: extracellular solute-binding protein [Propioniciclava sp.]|uniref:ABC transporter substrate-binding protein n=1 Tax=Propioniciclava sp. TaxID=2038686 RepID=UPI0039E40DAE
MRKTLTALGSGLLAAAVLATGCTSNTPAPGPGSSDAIDYWLWDSAQQPGYQQCADAFEAQGGKKVRITQYGWGDYWSKLTAGFIADQAPDVFTNHLAKYAQFVDLGVLLPLDELDATKGITDDEFAYGLAELWKGPDGHRYGTPKDWDTVGYFYDAKVTDAAGVTAQQLATMEWNPVDGGSFEKIIAHLTVDVNGVRGDEPGFDKNRIKVYGLSAEGGGGENLGQTQWGPYTGSLGNWQPLDKNPWGSKYNLDDPRFQEAISWYFGLAEKGYMPKYGQFSKDTGGYQQVAAGQAVLGLSGSWMISSFQGLKDIDLKIAPTPIGPSGQRSSPFNGLADSVTRFADDKEAAAEWVAFMASDACQVMIGEAGVVFPARDAGTQASLKARQAAGLDVSAFTVHLDEGTTQTLAVTTNAADIAGLTGPTFEAIYIGQQPVGSLTDLNKQVNRLLELASRG